MGERAAEAARGFSRQALHAARLGFEHPATGERLVFEDGLAPGHVGTGHRAEKLRVNQRTVGATMPACCAHAREVR